MKLEKAGLALEVVEKAIRLGIKLANDNAIKLKPDDKLTMIRFVTEQVLKALDGKDDETKPTTSPDIGGGTQEAHEREDPANGSTISPGHDPSWHYKPEA
jgi:hypothetical protein